MNDQIKRFLLDGNEKIILNGIYNRNLGCYCWALDRLNLNHLFFFPSNIFNESSPIVFIGNLSDSSANCFNLTRKQLHGFVNSDVITTIIHYEKLFMQCPQTPFQEMPGILMECIDRPRSKYHSDIYCFGVTCNGYNFKPNVFTWLSAEDLNNIVLITIS